VIGTPLPAGAVHNPLYAEELARLQPGAGAGGMGSALR